MLIDNDATRRRRKPDNRYGPTCRILFSGLIFSVMGVFQSVGVSPYNFPRFFIY